MEEQFYLAWPLAFAWARTLHRSAMVLAAAVASAPLVAAWATPATEWSLPFASVLACGCLFAMLVELRPLWFVRYVERRGLRLTLLCLAIAATIPIAYCRHRSLWPPVTVPLNAALVPCTCMLALLETTFENGWLRRALSTQAMVWLGRISYSLYLWQQLFMGAPSAYLKQWLWAQWPLNILLAIVCGGLGFWVIEQPAQRLRARWSRRRDSMPRTGPVRVGA